MVRVHARFTLARLALVAVVLAGPARVASQDIPSRLADSTFWRMITEMSEPDGFFQSDNLVSNEGSLQYVIPELQRIVKPGGVYLGVAPDQNFTYIVALRPKIAFIVDIRRGALLHHLLYKALLELSPDRADFVSKLFARPRPAGLDSNSAVTAIFAAFGPVAPDSMYYKRTFEAIKDNLVKRHGFPLSAEDFGGLEYILSNFYFGGPGITYRFSSSGGGGFGGAGMPSYEMLQMETDGTGARRAYLGSEANYRYLRDFSMRNLLVPVTGDFAGPKAIRAVGAWVRAHNATVTACYTSNVEQYLFQGVDNWRKYYTNLGTVPLDSTSTFIRSYSQGRGGFVTFSTQSPNSRSVQLIASMQELLKAFNAGSIQGYLQVIQMSRQ